MAITADRVIVELEAKIDRYNANVMRAQSQFEKSMGTIGASAKRTESVVSRSFGGIGTAFATAFTGALLIGGVKGFLGLADASKQLSSQLKLATASAGDYARAQKDVATIAAATRSGLNETGQLYANIARNAKDLGLTQTEVARVTTSVAQAFLISGSSAQEAAQGTRQLIQGLQSGTLRGDEFNSVMENAPRLARLLAESLNVPIGSLRAMAEAGDLTAAKLTAALSDAKYTAALDEEFKRLPVTFDQAMTLVQNAAQVTFGAFDSGGQFSTALANFVGDGADGFADLATAAEQLGIDIASAMAGLSSAFDPMLEGAFSAFGQINGEAASLRDSIASLLGSLDSVGGYIQRVRGNAGSLGNLLGGRPSLQGGGRYQETYDAPGMRARFLKDYRERQNKLTLGTIMRTGLTDFPAPDRDPGPARVAPGKAKKAKKGRKGPSAESLAAKAERAQLQQEREDAQYASDLARLNENILAAKAALVTAADAVAAYEVQEIETTRDRVNAGYAAEVAQKTMTAAQAEMLTLKNNELARLKVQAITDRETERKRADAVAVAQGDLQNQSDLAQSGARLADTREKQRDAALRILDLQYQIERAELENVIASNASTEAQKQIARRRLAILGQLQANDKAGVERDNEGPFDRYKREMNGLDLGDQLEETGVKALKSVEDQLTSTIGKALELKGVWGEMANAIIQDLIRIAIQQAITWAIGGGSGGGGGLGGLVGGIFGGGGGRASGGHVMGGKMYRVNESLGSRVEGFQPAGSGKIIPLGRMNQAGGGGTTIVQSFTLDARYGITTPELLRHVDRVATRKATQAGGAAFNASQKAVPGRIDRLQKLGS